MAGEKKARKMGAAEKFAHKEKSKPCQTCTGKQVWAKIEGKMRWYCESCGAFDIWAVQEGRVVVNPWGKA